MMHTFPELSSDSSSSGMSFESPSEITASFEAPPTSPPPSRARKFLRWSAASMGTLFLFVTFTVMQLPETRLKNTVQSLINQSLATRNMTMTSTRSELSIGLGVLYTLEDVTLTHPDSPLPAKLKKVQFSPSILGLFLNRLSGTAALESGTGQAEIHVSVGGLLSLLRSKTPSQGGTEEESGSTQHPLALQIHSENFDFGATQLLPFLIKTQLQFKVSGDAELNGTLGSPETYQGKVNWNLSQLRLPEQTVSGFKLPSLSMGSGQIQLDLENGSKKLNLTRVELGKLGAEDIAAQVKGVITLGRRMNESTLDSTLTLSVSEKVLQSIPLLQALLGMAKQPDGNFAYKLSGPLLTPFPVPLKQ